jgi:hypothetical protein
MPNAKEEEEEEIINYFLTKLKYIIEALLCTMHKSLLEAKQSCGSLLSSNNLHMTEQCIAAASCKSREQYLVTYRTADCESLWHWLQTEGYVILP